MNFPSCLGPLKNTLKGRVVLFGVVLAQCKKIVTMKYVPTLCQSIDRAWSQRSSPIFVALYDKFPLYEKMGLLALGVERPSPFRI